jgi:DNA-binding transcriptional LysR family regulator
MPLPEDMRTFVEVVDKRSFASAAAGLELTPSGVSKIISRLEHRLGIRLLTRTTRRLALTVEGAIYLARCREILAAIEDAEAEAISATQQPRGMIRISTGPGIGRHALAPLLPDFQAQYPDITIDLCVTDRRVDLLAENVDVALRVGTLTDSALLARKVAVRRRVIVASPAYLARHGTPKRPADLLKHNCITLDGFPHLRRWAFHGASGIERLEVTGNVTSDSVDVIFDLVVAGHGIARLADIQANAPLRSGIVRPLLVRHHHEEPAPVWALLPPGHNRLPRMRVFLDFLAARWRNPPWRATGKRR